METKGETVSRNRSFLIVATLLLAAAPAFAESSAICDDLRGRIADLPETIGTNRQAKQYSSAIEEQTAEIRKVTNDLADNECSAGSIVVINGEDDASCARGEDTLQRMQQNLRDLVSKRDQARRGNGPDDAAREELSAALQTNGCNDDEAGDRDTIISNRPGAPDAEPGASSAIVPLDQSGGPSGDGAYPQSHIQSYAYGQSSGGNVRTVCVRTCDGGFFPMTPNAAPGDFQRDGETCARMCPGVKTELFFHHPDQETSAMISASSGTPYTAMPYAFAFRKRPPNEKTSCTCNLPAYYEEMRRENALAKPQAGGQQQNSITTIKPASPSPVAPSASAKADAPPAERPYDPAAGKIRQVGPSFYSPDQNKLDLTHPAVPGDQPQQ